MSAIIYKKAAAATTTTTSVVRRRRRRRLMNNNHYYHYHYNKHCTSTSFSLLFFVIIVAIIVVERCTYCNGFVNINPTTTTTRIKSSYFILTNNNNQQQLLLYRNKNEYKKIIKTTISLHAEPPAITLENLSCTHDGGDNYQLRDVSYVLPRNVKTCLVGRNGAGKSTLLRILAESTCIDVTFTTADLGMKYTGQVTSPRDVRVAYVEQEPPMSHDVTVADALLGVRSTKEDTEESGNRSLYSIVRKYGIAAEQAEQDHQAFADASAAMDAVSGWDVLTKAEEVATRLRVRHLYEQPLSKLSGGERKRVALAAALTQQPDVLLLDEPTNYLSLAGVQWLADLLKENNKLTVLMVTHDRAFLDDVCDQILELDNGQLYEYKGSYADYLQAKEERLALEDAAVQSAKAKYRVELDWMRRQPQARESKSKARIDAFYKLEKATKPRAREGTIILESSGKERRIGGKVISMKNVNLRFGDKIILNDFSYDFCKGDRICLAGANGVGKTTFVRVLTGELVPDSGSVEIGDTVVIGVYDQLGIDIPDPTETLLEFVLQRVQATGKSSMSEAPGEARKLLKQFEFDRRRWNQRLSVLSGGERRRLQMLSIISTRPNFLVMDEPSVDLDLPTLQALEDYLQDFGGVLVLVSHDRYFADKVADHLFVFEGDGQIKDFPGTLSEYASTLVELENEATDDFRSNSISSEDKKATYKEDRAKRNQQRNELRKAKKDMDKLEKAIEKLRNKASDLQKEIDSSGDAGWTVLADLTEELNKANEQIDEKELQWMELAELVESAAAIEA